MARRKSSLFNLSFLDLLSGALGAVIFLFIITPKGGGSAPAQSPQMALFVDSISGQFYGDMPDSLRHKSIGDTLLTVLVDFRKMPGTEKQTEPKPVIAQREPVPQRQPEPRVERPTRNEEPTPETSPSRPTTPAPPAPKPPEPQEPEFRGDAPSVPCDVSFEVNWYSADYNIDLFVCKGSQCVYGGNKRERNIGQWDSGKSRNRLFGNDLRTNQEAVRQYDGILPGEYQIYAQFKESDGNRTSIPINGLIYTKDADGFQRGTSFVHTLPLSDERVLIGTVVLDADGGFRFIKP